MTTGAGGWGVPGAGSDLTTFESELLWGGDQGKGLALWMSAKYSGAMRDAGNTPTTVIRPGLLMAKVTSTGELEEWDADASDGTEYFFGILDTELRAQDFDATNRDRVFRCLVRGPVKTTNLFIQGTAFNSHADRYLARRMLVDQGFIFDDDPQGYLAGNGNRAETVAADTTVVGDDNGKTFFAVTADVDFTLPTIVPGLSFDFIRTDDFEMAVISAEGDNIIVGNDAAADSLTFTTAGEQIGAWLHVESHYVDGTLKWLLSIVKVPFSTDDHLTSAIAT